MRDRPPETPDRGFSLVQDPLLRVQRLLRLAPREGLGAVRRALVLVAITWLPIIIWAAATGHLESELRGESALSHLGIHVRCLLAIPLFVLSEPLAERVMGVIVANFVPSGLVRLKDGPAFAEVIRSIERWRDSRAIWTAIVLLVVVTAVIGSRGAMAEDIDALAWSQGAALDFGSRWALYVVRPLFLFMLLAWVWRLVITWLLFRRIARLDLYLVPSHPDRVGGLGFVEQYSSGFSLVVLAISSVVCAQAAHQIMTHGVRFAQLQVQLLSLVILVSVLFMLPITAFSGPLRRTRTRARFEYGTLAARHVRGVHERWVEGRPVEDEAILSAPEIGPVADVAALYELGTRMKPVPISRVMLGTLLLPAILPILLVASIEVPLKEILLKLVKALA